MDLVVEGLKDFAKRHVAEAELDHTNEPLPPLKDNNFTKDVIVDDD